MRGLSRECVQHALRWWRDACRQSAPFPGCLCLAGSALALCASDGAAVTVWTDPFGEPDCVLDLPNVTSLSTDGRTVLCASCLARLACGLRTGKTVRLAGAYAGLPMYSLRRITDGWRMCGPQRREQL